MTEETKRVVEAGLAAMQEAQDAGMPAPEPEFPHELTYDSILEFVELCDSEQELGIIGGKIRPGEVIRMPQAQSIITQGENIFVDCEPLAKEATMKKISEKKLIKKQTPQTTRHPDTPSGPTCPKCGQINRPGYEKCDECGRPREE